MFRVRLKQIILLCGCTAAIASCRREGSPPVPTATNVTAPTQGAADTPAALPPPADRPQPYPEGAWRSAPAEQLDRTMLWLSHILIRHAEVEESQMSFNLTGWLSPEPVASRTRREALELAQVLAETARAQGNFEAQARRFSEDPATRERGGSLGGLAAGHLSAWPQILDAVATLKPGDVSDVVETEYGYHLLHRRAAVPVSTVSGAHIVIAHAHAPWITLAARGPIPRRSRADALALARRVFEEAREKPGDFGRLAAEYSEHRDAARGGDFGSWSTHEVTNLPREVETLAGLQVGQVAEPIDTLFGYQVILRTADRPRRRYAMTKLQLRFDPEEQDSRPTSKAQMFAKAQELSTALRRDPSRFTAYQREWCCTDVWEVIEGRGLPALEMLLPQLEPGEVAQQPLEDAAVEYLIPMRVALDELPPRAETRWEMPAPNDLSHELSAGPLRASAPR